MSAPLSPGGLAILHALSLKGARLIYDGSALTVEHWPGDFGPTFERYLWRHAEELIPWAEQVDPWDEADAPLDPCPVCGGVVYHQAGDTGAWTCESCQPGQDRLSWARCVKVANVKASEGRVPVSQNVRPWETEEWKARVKRVPGQGLQGRIPRSTADLWWRKDT